MDLIHGVAQCLENRRLAKSVPRVSQRDLYAIHPLAWSKVSQRLTEVESSISRPIGLLCTTPRHPRRSSRATATGPVASAPHPGDLLEHVLDGDADLAPVVLPRHHLKLHGERISDQIILI